MCIKHKLSGCLTSITRYTNRQSNENLMFWRKYNINTNQITIPVLVEETKTKT